MRRHHVLLAAAVLAGCTENLPSGPSTFGASLQIVVPHDTVVVGDSSTAQARAIDAGGNAVQALQFHWQVADSTILAMRPGTGADMITGRSRTFVGMRPGRTAITAELPDSRFVAQAVTRTEVVVVGGVKVLTSRDTTLTALGDTARAIAAGLVRVNGALVPRASQGIRWIKLGTRTTMVGSGDTVRYIAAANGADTLIALSDLCLAGAKCADTVIARVSQQLSLTVTPRAFNSFSFGDTLAAAVTLADRRGNGLAGTSIRLVPRAAADFALVRVIPGQGTSNFFTGALVSPRLVTIGNGTAKVDVLGLAPDGFTILAADSLSATIRQVARYVAAEPLRASLSVADSIPVAGVARDARLARIADATVQLVAAGTRFNGLWAGPNTVAEIGSIATLTPILSGVAAPENNPLAPQVPATFFSSALSLGAVDTVATDSTGVTYSVTVLDSLGNPAVGSWIRLRRDGGSTPDSVQVGSSGSASVPWTPATSVGTYLLTGVRSAATLATLADSTGRIVLRRTMVVRGGRPDVTRSSVAISSTTVTHGTSALVTITMVDMYGNPATVQPGDFTIVATSGTITGVACTAGTCTATYNAPGAAGVDSLSVSVLGLDILNSPIALTIP